MDETATAAFNTDAEQYILGCAMVDANSMAIVCERLDLDDFYLEQHRLVYRAIVWLMKKGHPVDIVSVSEALKDHNALGVLGRSYINELAMAIATTEALFYTIDQLRRCRVRRECEFLARGIETMVLELEDPTTIVATVQNEASRFATLLDCHSEIRNTDLVEQAIESIERRQQGILTGASTGYYALDKMLYGLTPTHLTVLAARPGMGKSALATNIACNIAIRQRLPVLFFTLEMSAQQVMRRIVVAEAQTNSSIDTMRMVVVPEHLKILERPGLDLAVMRATVLKFQQQYSTIGLVVVDYLGLMEAEGKSSYERTKQISRGLKRMAIEMKVPVLALAQLSRSVEERQDKRPRLSDLRDSGSIEEDSDEVMFLYRDDYYNPDTNPGMAQVCVDKNRDGSTGNISLSFVAHIARFYD